MNSKTNLKSRECWCTVRLFSCIGVSDLVHIVCLYLPVQLRSQVAEGRCLSLACSEKARDQAVRVLKHFNIQPTPSDIFSRCQVFLSMKIFVYAVCYTLVHDFHDLLWMVRVKLSAGTKSSQQTNEENNTWLDAELDTDNICVIQQLVQNINLSCLLLTFGSYTTLIKRNTRTIVIILVRSIMNGRIS